uniref:Uncharacterized protein n=2 Tax=Mantoniella antarctica TaxID=81844 RepID=A0A7S0SN21_9CHLO
MSKTQRSKVDDHPDGFWLVPVCFPDAVPHAVHLALVPATCTPSPEEIAGTPAERTEAARRAMLGLPPDRDLVGSHAHRTAAERAAAAGHRAFDPKRLEDYVVVEITAPVVYNELHAVVPMVASASPGGSIVCWADDNALWARRTGRHRTPGACPPARAVVNLQMCGLGAAADPGGGNPVLHHVAAMQWCPSGRRLLLLVVVHVATMHHVFPLYQWVVWDPPSSWLEEDEADEDEVAKGDCGDGWGATTAHETETEAAAQAGRAAAHERYHGTKGCGTLSQGRWHVPSSNFLQDCLPIFEQYSQTHMLWNPAEDAVVYSARNDAENAEYIELQHFPPREAQPEFPTPVHQEDAPFELPYTVRPTPPAVVVCEGSFCVWSPC